MNCIDFYYDFSLVIGVRVRKVKLFLTYSILHNINYRTNAFIFKHFTLLIQ